MSYIDPRARRVRIFFSRRAGPVGLVVGFTGVWLWSSYPVLVAVGAIVSISIALWLDWQHPKKSE